jgi:hypothetical protein
MPAKSRSSSETLKDVLLWGVGVVAPILLMLILIWCDPQGMPEGHKDEQPIPDWVAAVAGSSHQAIDLALCQVLALPVISPTSANCRLFRLRGPQLDNRIHWQIPPLSKSTVDIMAILPTVVTGYPL